MRKLLCAMTAVVLISSFLGADPNGRFVVEVGTSTGWLEVARPGFNEFIGLASVDLSDQGAEGADLRIRLRQEGGGAAHLDSVLLGGNAPTLGDREPGEIGKLSRSDWDVVDVAGRAIELAFASGSRRDLQIAGRIEGERISETPFQFPPSNLYTEIGPDSEFYRYRIDSEAQQSMVFRELCITGSGHPWAFTYGWVWNDEENLYVKLDFTPDNTMDGAKDYAAVYVRGADGAAEYRVSSAETEWGCPRFIYTPRVGYQHKVYDFAIPLAELGDAGTLELAFAAYGTAAAPDPAVVYDTDRFRYFAVFGGYDGGGLEVHGQLVRPDGVPQGDLIGIATGGTLERETPALAYDPVNQRYLVVWHHDPSIDSDVYGRLISADGMTFLTDPFVICDAADMQNHPAVAFNENDQQYLVVWSDSRNVDWDIYGRMVTADGTPDPEFCFPISQATDQQYRPDVAWDAGAGEFIVVWEDDRGGALDIYAQIVEADKTLALSPELVVISEVDTQEGPAVAFDGGSGQFLVTWADYRSGSDSAIYGRLIASGGTAVEAGFPLVQSGSMYMYRSDVTYSSATGGYVAVWEDNSGAYYSLYGQEVTADGAAVLGDEFGIVVSTWDADLPAVAANAYSESALLVYRSDEPNPDPWVVDFAVIGEDYAMALLDKESLDFGSLHTGEISTVGTFEVTNPSGEDLVIATVALTGGDADQFTIQTELNGDITVAWAETWTLEVLFAPTSAGAKTATIELASGDPADDPVVLGLTGEGTNTAPGVPALVFPDDALTNVSAAEVVFIWSDVIDDDEDTVSHTFYLSTTDDFEGITPVEVAAGAPPLILLAGASLGLLFAAACAARGRKRIAVLLLVVACVVCLGLGACRAAGPGDPVVNPDPEVGQKSHAVADLLTATTYYWKVVVDDGLGGVAESEVRSFTTQ